MAEPDLAALGAVRSVEDLDDSTRPWFALGEPLTTDRYETAAVLSDADDTPGDAPGDEVAGA